MARMISLLVRCGAVPDVQRGDGMSALMYAATSAYMAVLLEHAHACDRRSSLTGGVYRRRTHKSTCMVKTHTIHAHVNHMQMHNHAHAHGTYLHMHAGARPVRGTLGWYGSSSTQARALTSSLTPSLMNVATTRSS